MPITNAVLKQQEVEGGTAMVEPEVAQAPAAQRPFVIRSLTKLRLRAVWLAVPLFFIFARPSVELLLAGALLAAVGNLVRAWAAGTIHKNVVLTTGGPYAHTRNPLYLGTLLIGIGLSVASGRWFFVLGFLLFFASVYGLAIRTEANRLERVFGAAYREYARRVPLLLPRLTAYRPRETESAQFRVKRYVRNREYLTGLGVIVGFLGLIAKLLWF